MATATISKNIVRWIMALDEPREETGRILTDAEGKLIFLPNVIRASELYKKDLSAPIKSEDFKNALPELFLNYVTNGVEESPIDIDGIKYKATYRNYGGPSGSIYLSPQDNTEASSLRIDPNRDVNGIKLANISSPDIYTSGNPPVVVSKYESYVGNDMEKKYEAVYLTIPKDKIKLGIEDEDKYEKIEISIIEDTKEGTRLSIGLSNQYTDAGEGYPRPVLSLNEHKDSEDPIEGVVDLTVHFSPTFTIVEAGTTPYNTARDILLSVAQQVTGKKFRDTTPNELVQDLFQNKDVAETNHAPDNKPKDKLLTAFMVDGLYTPSCQELVQLIKKQDMPKLLESSQISDADLDRPNTLSITFNNSEEAHLFALALVAKGFENNLFTNGPSDDFYENKPLENFRVDGNQLALNEEPDGDKSKAILRLNYSDGYDVSRKERYTELIHQVIDETMPHLSDKVKDFRFT